MNELSINRTPEVIGAEIRTLTHQARCITLWYGIEIGRRLTEAKEMVAHGEWLTFLKDNTEFSQPSASRFMKLFEEYGSEQSTLFGAESKYSTLNNLSVSNALRLLAIPAEERESFAEEVDAEHISTRELEKAIAEKKAAEDRAKKAEKELSDALEAGEGTALLISSLESKADKAEDRAQEAEKMLAETRKMLKEAENRPTETVFERDEAAIAEAAAAAKAEAEKEIEKLRAAVEKAEAKAEKATKAKETAEAKAKTAKETADAEARKQIAEASEKLERDALAAQEEASELRQQLEEARGRLKTADPDTALFKAYFAEAQKTFNTLVEHFERAAQNNPETGTKLKAAMKAMLDHCRAQIEAE